MSKKEDLTIPPPLAPAISANPNNSLEEQNDKGASSIDTKDEKILSANERKKLEAKLRRQKRMQESRTSGKISTFKKKELMVIQGATMAAALASGQAKSINELAKQFDMTHSQTQKRLELAKRMEIVDIAKEMISTKLLPKALAVLSKELDAGNYKAAKDILFGLGILEANSKSVVEHSSVNKIPSLTEIRLERLRKSSIDAEVIEKEEVNS